MKTVPFIPTMNPIEKVYAEKTGIPYPVGASVAARVYNFTSYDSTGEIEYATGTAQPTGTEENDRLKIKILTNSVEGFAGKIYWVSNEIEDHVGDDTKFPLYESSDSAESVGIQVSISLDE